MKILLRSLVIFTLSMNVALAQSPFASVTLPAEEIEFISMGPVGGIEIAFLWGDGEIGASAAFVRFPPGSKSPMHYHPHGYHAVVMSGGVKHLWQGQSPDDAPLLGPGSYWYQAGGEDGVHAEHYYSEGPTVLYVQFEGARGSISVEEQ